MPFLAKLFSILIQIFNIFQFVLLLWIVMSWIPSLQGNGFYRALDRFFATLLEPIRKVVPPIGGTLDISPIILIIALRLIISLIGNFLT